jgi:hypothetical protein
VFRVESLFTREIFPKGLLFSSEALDKSDFFFFAGFDMYIDLFLPLSNMFVVVLEVEVDFGRECLNKSQEHSFQIIIPNINRFHFPPQLLPREDVIV